MKVLVACEYSDLKDYQRHILQTFLEEDNRAFIECNQIRQGGKSAVGYIMALMMQWHNNGG